ncbi:Selenoprotein O and cysteine-containing [Pseudonocardia sp. Ae717_Ps2]|uniref:protein adenylyltransferase SelO n=1 Tax=Pseudonocardia sp. Ae717_Ps2 TaxID=1885573 RepID=UPI0009631834|nr:protein adenylyltransferase SelO family protein [Pseudonocardia sp. Ae717_Ps2]OLM31242.1 Selenoprotein O and cysteine-containing [Pseudonocardia sp. Ae717_Ps2]
MDTRDAIRARPGEWSQLTHTYARDVPALSVPWPAVRFPDPRVLVRNDDLGVGPVELPTLVGDGVDTRALAYAGHQWGVYKPRLGDGRALLAGELPDGRDLHLKGIGPPFSRGLDGRAAVGPMLREYLFGEAMHALGIPTTRALAVVATGERIERDGRELPGAVLTRVAASHLRVGTFQYAAVSEPGSLRALADHAIARHFPDAARAVRPYRELFGRVVDAQAALVARWMLVGFVHGVMSTDNTTISGETIDYGPCAFMDAVDPATVFSSLDTTGRYAYAAQPEILRWNLARLAESLRPLDDVEDLVDEFPRTYERYWARGMAAKLGLSTPDAALATDLMALLHAQHVDFTTFFRALAAGTARDLFLDRAAFDAWAVRRAPLVTAGRAAMDRVNPLYVPRNHVTDAALAAAEHGDLDPFHRLLAAVREPYVERPGLADLTRPGTGPHVTYCGT